MDVPKIVRGSSQSTLSIAVTTPLAGKVAAVALSEDNKALAKSASELVCKLQVTARPRRSDRQG